jgi:hypothetical protein
MATQAGPRGRWAPERRFYTGMALAMIALVLIGFGPSFYFRGSMHFPRPNPTLPPMMFLPLFWWDRRTLDHLHWASKLGAGLFASMLVARHAVMAWAPGAWEGLAAALPGV